LLCGNANAWHKTRALCNPNSQTRRLHEPQRSAHVTPPQPVLHPGLRPRARAACPAGARAAALVPCGLNANRLQCFGRSPPAQTALTTPGRLAVLGFVLHWQWGCCVAARARVHKTMMLDSPLATTPPVTLMGLVELSRRKQSFL
jgi:hypothetical protein